MIHRALLLFPVLLLVACGVRSPSPHAMGGHGDPSTDSEARFVLKDASREGEIVFAIEKDGAAFEEYAVNHTKRMHLIVVRDDLRHFRHLHPEQDASGRWHAAFTAPAGGAYRLYADFVERDGTPRTLRFDRSYPGAGARDTGRDFSRSKTFGAYAVHLAVLESADAVTFRYDVTDRADKPVVFEEYLGAKGHSVLLGPDGAYVHMHPFAEYTGYQESDPPVFAVTEPLAGFHRAYTQFQIDGEVITVDFDWQP